MKSWIHLAKGRYPRQAHVQVPEGLKEEEIGRGGFQGRAAEVYRLHEPTAWTRVEGDFAPMDVDGSIIDASDRTDPCGGLTRCFYNDDLTISVSRRSEPMPFWLRNADGDELWFVHRGTGVMETEFGPLEFRPGHYIVLPKGVTYRLVPETRDNYFLHIECTGEIALAEHTLLGRHNPYDPTVIEAPEPKAYDGDGRREYEVRVKRCGMITSFFYDHHPLDVVGWKGDLFPFRFHNLDFRAVVSDRNHVPPTAFALFQGPGFVVCNFVPRPAEMERGVSRLPYYHRNMDYDEIGFLHDGTMMGAPMLKATFMVHPRGAVHGPGEQARAMAEQHWDAISYYDLQAVNIDAVRPLTIAPEARAALRSDVQLISGKRDG
ncbi:MAG TPA: homogentisate 1,2-dioxygenase [Candidatus Limnocylindrales bacterium]|nr:homogentisate 1,2-dioxygenase [Candidatus Limnocylindrales bacterium]